MTGEVNEKYLTPQERKARQMVKAVNEASPRNLPADAVVCPCENEHRPVYPVRYAYSNLFGNENAQAGMPPPIKKLLELCPTQPDLEIYEPEICSVEETNGFSARLLRSGWIYVFEEGEYPTRTDTKGQLLIFQHIINYAHNGQIYNENDHSEETNAAIDAGDAEEYFIPHTRIYNTDSHTWEIKAEFPYYPYLAIKKDVCNARFFFSDIPLSDYTINKIANDANFRKSFMQEINLVDFNNNPYLLEVNEEHINHLIEEYKEENIRFSAFVDQAKQVGAKLPNGKYFAEITNTPNISKGSQALLNKIKSSLDYNEKSGLIILHDPVGYQKDILALYSFITTAYTTFQHQWSYPNQVGHYLFSIYDHLIHPDIVQTESGSQLYEKFLDNIDMEGWNTYWPEIELAYKEFEKIQNNIIRLYCDFLTNPIITDKIGGIKNYIDHVFLIKEQFEKHDFWHIEFFEEIKNYCEFHELLLTPLNSTKYGQESLELLFSIDKKEGEIWKNLSNIIVKLLHKKNLQYGAKDYFRKQIVPSLQSVLLICWNALGYAFTQTHAQLKKRADNIRNITQAGIDFLAKKVLPVFLGFFGIGVNTQQLQPLSGKQFMDWMNTLNGKITPLKNVPSKMKMLFNWDAKFRNSKATHVFNTIQYYYTSTGLPVDKQTLKNTVSLGSSIYSLLTGILALHAAKMSEYDKNDPLHTGAANIFRMQMAIFLTNTAVGIVATRQAAGVYMQRVTYPPLRHILMKVSLPEAQTKLAKGAVKSVGYIVALLGVALPIVEGVAELNRENSVTSGAKFTEAVATFVLNVGVAGVGKANAIINGTAVLSRNPLIRFITRFAWQIVLTAVLLLIVSAFIYYLFKTDKFEELLKNCFWGNGSKYFAGGYKIKENQDISRPGTIQKQLNRYIEYFEEYSNYYQIELQEFLNFFFSPKLSITSKVIENLTNSHYGSCNYIIQYQFKLTNFQFGLSEINYQLIEPKKMFLNQSTVKTINQAVVIERNGFKYINSTDSTFNKAFEQAFEQAFSSKLNSTFSHKEDFNFSFKVDAGISLGDPLKNHSIPSLYWYYVIDRINGDIAPLRYRNANLQDKIYGYINDEDME